MNDTHSDENGVDWQNRAIDVVFQPYRVSFGLQCGQCIGCCFLLCTRKHTRLFLAYLPCGMSPDTTGPTDPHSLGEVY